MHFRSLLITFLLLLISSPAFAFKLNVAIGLKGGLNGSVANGVEEGDTFKVDGNDRSVSQGPDIYPMFGLGASVGASLELRVDDVFGLEIDLYQSWDNANGFEDKNDAASGQTIGRINQEQRTSALHLPVLLKASVPGSLVRPTFGLGMEFVFQGESKLNYSSDRYTILEKDTGYEFGNIIYQIEPTNYINLIASFALEFDIDPIRIPIELRLQINPSFKKAADPRLNGKVDGGGKLALTYDGVYQAQFSLFTGIAYDFDLNF